MASEKEKTAVHVTVEASDFWWVSLFVLLVVAFNGDPDLMDVLQEWCRRYLESSHGE